MEQYTKKEILDEALKTKEYFQIKGLLDHHLTGETFTRLEILHSAQGTDAYEPLCSILDSIKKPELNVLLVEPKKRPRMVTIPHELSDMQGLVGGYIETVYPFDDPVVLVCNEEGKLEGLTLNRALFDDNGRVYDIISGSFFIAHVPPEAEDFQSMPDDLAQKYAARFAQPEVFAKFGNEIIPLPYEQKNDAPER